MEVLFVWAVIMLAIVFAVVRLAKNPVSGNQQRSPQSPANSTSTNPFLMETLMSESGTSSTSSDVTSPSTFSDSSSSPSVDCSTQSTTSYDSGCSVDSGSSYDSGSYTDTSSSN